MTEICASLSFEGLPEGIAERVVVGISRSAIAKVKSAHQLLDSIRIDSERFHFGFSQIDNKIDHTKQVASVGINKHVEITKVLVSKHYRQRHKGWHCL